LFGFHQVWCCDTEYGPKPDGSFGPDIRCLVAKELYSGETIRLWFDELYRLKRPPFDIENSLFVAYNATAELQCFVELGWPFPRNILDLFAEYRAITNGTRAKQEHTRLIDAAAYYHLDHISSIEKEEMQQLAIRGGPYTEEEKTALLEYCESDVDALIALLRSDMADDLRAFHPREMLFRGRFMAAQTRSDRIGIPTEEPMLAAIQEHRETILQAVIDGYERQYKWNIFEDYVLRQELVSAWLKKENITLPKTKKTQKPSLSDKVLEKAKLRYEQLVPLHECLQTRNTLSARVGLTVDADGRSRFFANNFGTTSGRDKKFGKEFLPSMPAWARFLMKPAPGEAIAHIDISAQEIVYAAAWSREVQTLIDYYRDIYMQQAIRRGQAPVGATKKTHGPVRSKFKPLVLGPNYGQTEFGVAHAMKIDIEEAREYLDQYWQDYPKFRAKRRALINGTRVPGRRYFTSLGWPLWVDGLVALKDNDRSGAIRAMLNHPMQAGGSDWMRIVMIAATEAGIQVCFSLHDGFLILASIDRIEAEAERMVRIIKGAGAALLGVPVLVGEPEIVCWPDRFVPDNDKGEHEAWRMIVDHLDHLGALPPGFSCPIARPAPDQRKSA
jgi:DNA polymerase I